MSAAAPPFWTLSDAAHWSLAESADVAYDPERAVLRLRSARSASAAFREDHAEAARRRDRVPLAMDPYDTWCRWDELRHVVEVGGVREATVERLALPEARVHDLVRGDDGILYVALNDAVRLHDLRNRWDDVTLASEGLRPWRLAEAPGGGVWVVGQPTPGEIRLARLVGEPPHRLWADDAPPVGFAPHADDRPAPRFVDVATVALLAEEQVVALASSPDREPTILTWVAGEDARVRVVRNGASAAPVTLRGARSPYTLRWIDERRVAVLVTGLDEALTFDLTGGGVASAEGDLLPLPGHDGGPFARGGSAPHYPSESGLPRPLCRISLPAYPTTASVRARLAIDSGDVRTVWHRLYVEAVVPPTCAVVVWLAATDGPTRPDEASPLWFEHTIGNAGAPPSADIPRGQWVPFESEVPFAPSLLCCPRKAGVAGLFTVLAQRAGRRVRTLRGRYLHARVELRGDGRSSPELRAIRVYGPREAWAERWLPEVYRESVFGPDADVHASSTGEDFWGRFLANCEGALTLIDARIRAAHTLSDPAGVPDESIEWLGAWVGMTFDASLPAAARRALLAAAPALRAWHGTLRGLRVAVDAVTGGATRDGRVVIVEDFRLRRTFMTVLGLDQESMVDTLSGARLSGNSQVGDTLVLADDFRAEFVATFQLQTTRAQGEALRRWFDALAHRVTVLVQEGVDAATRALVERAVDLEAPAHVRVAVAPASRGFLIGIAALIGVDTSVGAARPPAGVRVGHTRLGAGEVLQHPASLDPRFGGGGLE